MKLCRKSHQHLKIALMLMLILVFASLSFTAGVLADDNFAASTTHKVSASTENGFLITCFCPDGYAANDGDEFFVLEGNGDLTLWSVTDGEGTVSFPDNQGGWSAVEGTRKVIVARDGELYYSIHKSYPDYEIADSGNRVANAIVSGRFQMANTDDSLTLLEGGSEVQKIAWPAEVKTGNGRVHVLKDGTWDPRIFKIGQSDISPKTFIADSATLFVSPDCSHEVITDVIDDAKSSIIISMYEFTSPSLAKSLVSAANRGVEITILMEGGPVGGMSKDEKGVLNHLARTDNIRVFTIESVGKLPARYRYLHTKYLVADEKHTIVLSENFKDSGIPKSGAGNRGWGVVIHDNGVARYFLDVFQDDMKGYDIHPWIVGDEAFPDAVPTTDFVRVFHPKTVENCKVTPVFAPDTSSLIGDALLGAKSSIDIQQAYISHYPDSDNPWLMAAINAADNGAIVRIQLDGMYYNTDSDADNDEIAASVNKKGLENLGAKLLSDRDGITKIHNKGLIVDEQVVLISSINWNYNSPMNNREAAVLIDNADAAKYYSHVFSYDWEGVVLDNPASAAIGFDVRFVIAGVIVVGLIILFIVRRRR